MGLDYKTVKACADAQALLRKNHRVDPIKRGDRTYEAGNGIMYSQQEVLIPRLLRGWPHHQHEHREYNKLFPTGVEHWCYRRPDKEYVSFNDAGGVQRYYVVPEEGIRLQLVNGFYKVANPVLDYRVVIDRTKSKEAREPAEELYRYIDLLWDMIPKMTWQEASASGLYYRIKAIPAIDDKTAWHAYINAAKNASYDGVEKSTLLAEIRKKYAHEALAFNVTQVHDTVMDHTEHWCKIDELRAAGKLEQFEGKVKKRRKKKTNDS